MRRLMTAILLGATLLAPAALAESAGPSIPPSALDGGVQAKPAKARPAAHAKKRTARHTARKASAHRKATKAKAPAHRVPAKQAVITGQMLV